MAKDGHEKVDYRFQTATCSNCGKVGYLRAVCRNTNTHEIEKDADKPSPDVTVEEVWCMAVRDTVDDGHCDHIEKHDVSSEDRDESNRNESKFRRVIKNIETDQNPRNVIKNIETGQCSKNVIKSIETGQNSRKVITNIGPGQSSRKVVTNTETCQNSEKWSRDRNG